MPRCRTGLAWKYTAIGPSFQRRLLGLLDGFSEGGRYEDRISVS